MRVSAYVHMRRDTPVPLSAPVHILDDPLPFPQLRTNLMDDLFLNKKTNDNIQIWYSLKYKHSKNKWFFAKKWMVVLKGSSINKKPNSSMWPMLRTVMLSSIWYCRFAPAYFPYFRAIRIQRYCTWSQSRYPN